MKHTRHKPEQIIRKLRQAEQMINEGQAVSDVCRALEVSTATYPRWQQFYGARGHAQGYWYVSWQLPAQHS